MIITDSEFPTIDFTAIAKIKDKPNFASFKVLGNVVDNSNKEHDIFNVEIEEEIFWSNKLKEKNISLKEYQKTCLLFLRCISIFLSRHDNYLKGIEENEVTHYCKSLVKEIIVFKKFETHISYFKMTFDLFNTQVEAKFYR